MGYHRAGFEVVGVDIKPQPRYPFAFVQTDALDFCASFGAGFDAIHASPPCQAFSSIAKQQRQRRAYNHPDLVDATRRRLTATGRKFIIENVTSAPLRRTVRLCGSSFDLDVRRHRLFELGGWEFVFVPSCAHHLQAPRFRSLDKRRGGKLACVVGVHGHANYAGERALRERAMGIDWMSSTELAQAIPPAYTEYIGRQLLASMADIRRSA